MLGYYYNTPATYPHRSWMSFSILIHVHAIQLALQVLYSTAVSSPATSVFILIRAKHWTDLCKKKQAKKKSDVRSEADDVDTNTIAPRNYQHKQSLFLLIVCFGHFCSFAARFVLLIRILGRTCGRFLLKTFWIHLPEQLPPYRLFVFCCSICNKHNKNNRVSRFRFGRTVDVEGFQNVNLD